MKQIRLLMNEYLDNMGLEEYLLSIKGIKKVVIDRDEIIIDYDNEVIGLKVIKLEINLFIGINRPITLMFDKNTFNDIQKEEYIKNDVCCEMCLLYLIDELIEIEGIETVDVDYDGHHYYSVKFTIGYNKDKISWDQICEILQK